MKNSGLKIIVTFFQKAPAFRGHVRFSESPKISLPKKTPESRKRWLLKIYILGRNHKKKYLEELHSLKFFLSTQGTHWAHLNHRHGQKLPTSLTNKKSEFKKWWKKYLPLPFPVQPNLYYLQHCRPNTHPWPWKIQHSEGEDSQPFVVQPTQRPFSSHLLGSNKKKVCGMGSGKKMSDIFIYRYIYIYLYVYICSYMWGNGESPKNVMFVVLLTLLQIYF